MNARTIRTGALLLLLLAVLLFLSFYFEVLPFPADAEPVSATLDSIPLYTDAPYVVLTDNQPNFAKEELVPASFESYSELDSLGRCGVAYACIGEDLMPTEERESISSVHPSGWQNAAYDFVDGRYLYNRCHLIGFQLAGENANALNLITGTRYLNVQGMLPFENMVADYVKETGNHVLYRVTPIFRGNDLVAQGVEMEAMSVEDDGDGILFHVYCYNVQPGVEIDYATGANNAAAAADDDGVQHTYILNTNSKKFHDPACPLAESIKEKNRDTYKGTRELLIRQGYTACQNCNP